MKKRFVAMLLALIMLLGLLPVSAMAANGTGHQISVKIYKVVLDSSKPLGYQNPELINTITVTCQDSTGHSGYNHSVNLKEFYPTNVGASTTDWSGWEFDSYYTKGKEQKTFYDWTSSTVNATANVTGSEPYPCSKNFYLVYKDSKPAKPANPNDGNTDLATDAVKVHCIKNAHDDKDYPVQIASSTEATYNGSVYTSTVTIAYGSYKDRYTTATGAEHTLDTTTVAAGGTVNAEKTATFNVTWNATEGRWKFSPTLTKPYVTFNVKCETVQPPVDDDDPGDKKPDFTEKKIAVKCVNTTSGHQVETYALDTNYTIGEGQGKQKNGDKWTYTVTVNKDHFIDAYKTKTHKEHSEPDPTATYTIRWEWIEKKWVNNNDPWVKILVECEDECPEFDPTDLGNNAVKVVCQNPKKASEHLEKTYALLEGSYTVVKPTTNEGDNIWTGGKITIKAQKYVEKYNETYIGHTAVAPDEYTFDLVYHGDDGWQIVDEQGEQLDVPYAEFKAVCADYPNPDESNTNPTSVRVQCVNPLGGHLWEDFRIKAGSYTFTAPITTDNTSGATTCTIRVYPQKYLDAYLYHNSFNHSAQESYLDIPLTWNGAKWLTNKPDGTYVFHVVCTWTLSFDSNGGTAVPSQTVWHNYSGTKPAPDPTRTGYTFTGWYVDPACTTLYDFDTILTADRTVYAGWSWNYYPIYRPVKATPKFNTTDHFAYVQGYPNGSVKPTGNITRAETAAILFRLMDEGTRTTYYSTKSGFRDVSSNNWFNTYVATLNAAGVITDSANGYFRPNDAITRAELAAMLAQFADTKSAANYFNDVAANHWAANAIAVCVKLGWINGYPDGSFRPDNYITRAELMAMINRATGRTPKTADAFLNGMKTWTDNLDTTKWYYVDVQEATNSHDYIGALNEKWTALRSAPNWSVYE